jgi:hypothetical protein
MRPSQAALLFFFALPWVGACGGSSPTARTPTSGAASDPTGLPPGTPLTVVSGENGEGVGGARVVVASRSYESDSHGQVTLAERAAFGSLVDVVAAGFLDRQTKLRSGGSPRFVLWPRTTASGLDERYTSEIVYTAAVLDPPPSGSSPLERLRLGTTQAFVVLSGQIREDDRAHVAHEDAVAALNWALAGRIVYALAPAPPSTGLVFEASVDPTADLCVGGRVRGFTSLTHRSGEITQGRIVYCSLEVARTSTVAHELGHTTGLQHSPDFRDVMASRFSRTRRDEFGDREALVLALLLERRGGNRYPDNDRESSTSGEKTTRIACP